MSTEWYADQIKRLLDQAQADLEVLTSGKLRTFHREGGGPEIETTETDRKRAAATVATYQDILARLAGTDD